QQPQDRCRPGHAADHGDLADLGYLLPLGVHTGMAPDDCHGLSAPLDRRRPAGRCLFRGTPGVRPVRGRAVAARRGGPVAVGRARVPPRTEGTAANGSTAVGFAGPSSPRGSDEAWLLTTRRGTVVAGRPTGTQKPSTTGSPCCEPNVGSPAASWPRPWACTTKPSATSNGASTAPASTWLCGSPAISRYRWKWSFPSNRSPASDSDPPKEDKMYPQSSTDRTKLKLTETPRLRRGWASRTRRRLHTPLYRGVVAAGAVVLRTVDLMADLSGGRGLLLALLGLTIFVGGMFLVTQMNRATRMSLPYRLLDERQRTDRDTAFRISQQTMN